ncbi:MAG: T9SS type A sorting domain-containing protein, partial [Bacteroidales bacterium]|nr:T9SS type A sorting domain-containing protein [Bacteroidales bacterium]
MNATVLVVSDENSLTTREIALTALLDEMNLSHDILNSNPDMEDLTSYDLIIATEDGALGAAMINDLVDAGNKVLLLYNAGAPLGGTWDTDNVINRRNLVIENDAEVFHGYQTNLPTYIQHGNPSCYFTGNLPAGWTIAGSNYYSANKTVMFRKHNASNGKGLVFTFNPQYFTGQGKNFFVMAIEWLTSINPMEGINVHEGDVAFIISNHQYNNSEDLSDSESNHYNRLVHQGYNITVIPFGKLSNSDLTQASLVTAVEYPSIDRNTINQLFSNGQQALLLKTSAATIGGTWDVNNAGNNQELVIEENIALFDGFRSNLNFSAETKSPSASISAMYPAGWRIIGTTFYEKNKTVLLKENGDTGGKVLVMTYDPANYSEEMKNFADRAIEWVKGVRPYEGIEVPEGDVAFIISGYNDSFPPTLTDAENAHYNTLLAQGYEVTFIRSGRLDHSNLSGARLITAVEYPSISKHCINNQLALGKNLLLLKTSAAPIGGTWDINNVVNNLSFVVQTIGASASIESDYPFDWQSIGNTYYEQNKSVLLKEDHSSSGKALVITYDPKNYSESMKNFSDLAYFYLEEEPPYPGITVPEGNVAFLITNYDDQDNPDLTTLENNYYSFLLDQGYKVSFMRFTRMFNSDFSEAKFITGIEFPTFNRDFIDQQLESGNNILATYHSGAIIGGEWDSHNNDFYKTLVVKNNSSFLSAYDIDESIPIQESGEAYFIKANYPQSYSILGENVHYSEPKTVLSKTSATSRALIFPYNAGLLIEDGKSVLKNIIAYFDEPLEAKENKMILYDVEGVAGKGIRMSLGITNESEITGFSLSIPLPEGFSYAEGMEDLYRHEDHTVTITNNENNILSIACSSPSKTAFRSNEGTVLSFYIFSPNDPKTHGLDIEEAEITDVSGKNVWTESQNATITLFPYQEPVNLIRGGPQETNPLAIPIQITGVGAELYNTDLNQWTGNWQAPQAIYDQGTVVNQHHHWWNIEGNEHTGSTWVNINPGESYGILVVDLQEVRQIYNINVFQMFSDGKTSHLALDSHPETGNVPPDAFDENWHNFLPVSLIGPGINQTDYVIQPSYFSVDHQTRYVKIRVWNDGSMGNPEYIELKGLKMFGEGDLPIVLTEGFTDRTATSATLQGNVIYEGRSPINSRGIIWHKDTEPSVSNWLGFDVPSGDPLGSFEGLMSQLEPATTYYIRSYASNVHGVSYGSVTKFTTPAEGAELYQLTLICHHTDISPDLFGKGSYQPGEKVLITAGKVDGYEFLIWDGNETALQSVETLNRETTYVTIPNHDVSLYAVYQSTVNIPLLQHNGLTLSPNPFTHVIYVDNAQSVSHIKVTNILGATVYEKPINNREKTLSIDLAYLTKGVYIVFLKNEKGDSWIQKIIKK